MWYFFSFRYERTATILVNENGIEIANYEGSLDSLSEFDPFNISNFGISTIVGSKPAKHFGWNEIESVGYGRWWRFWILFTKGNWLGIRYMIIKTKDSKFFISILLDLGLSTKFHFTYKSQFLSIFKELGKGTLLIKKTYKF